MGQSDDREWVPALHKLLHKLTKNVVYIEREILHTGPVPQMFFQKAGTQFLQSHLRVEVLSLLPRQVLEEQLQIHGVGIALTYKDTVMVELNSYQKKTSCGGEKNIVSLEKSI